MLKEKEAFKNLARLLEKQTDYLGPKGPKVIQSNSMQNPHEPEATYRVKGKKGAFGYAMNKELDVKFSALNGRPANQEKLSSTQFTINPETELITACSKGAVPVSAKRNENEKFYRLNSTKNRAACP